MPAEAAGGAGLPVARAPRSSRCTVNTAGRLSAHCLVCSAPMETTAPAYPSWKFYPSRSRAPAWVTDVVAAFADAAPQIDSRSNNGLTSDAALALLRPRLVQLGFEIEAGKTAAGKIRRPVLFGENGRPIVAYEVDGFHADRGIVLEIEAGRGAAGNADYRDLVRTSLIVDAEYLVLGMRLEYRTGKTTMRSYERTRDQIDAIYASERLQLPFSGILLIGY